jgi:hypothetical protein
VEAVEQKVRIDLRAQRLQLGVARQEAQLERPPFGRLRRLEGDQSMCACRSWIRPGRSRG